MPFVRLLAVLAALLLAGCGHVPPSASGPSSPPLPGGDTRTPHEFSTTVIGTAIVQDVRDGFLFFDFTDDSGRTEAGLKVRAASIDGLGDTWLEPRVRLRLKLTRQFLQLGTTTPRETGRAWEMLRTR